MGNIAKKDQNYLVVNPLHLQSWYERMHEQEVGPAANVQQSLPKGDSGYKELDVDFDKWNNPIESSAKVIEEYLWGVRCGIMQFVDVDNCSLEDALSVARTDQMCEIYSPAKVEYYADGSRRVIPHQVSVYNTDAKFACYSLINRQQAANLFPQYAEVFERLPQESKFLCSPEGDKIRFANQERGEFGFSFSAVDTEIDDVAFYLGNLRPTFQYVAREIEAGRGYKFCNPNRLNELNYLNSRLGIVSGGLYPFTRATELVSEAELPAMRSAYIKQGMQGRENYRVLIDGHFVNNDTNYNQLVVKDGQDIKHCMPPAVYRSWGAPLNKAELAIIQKGRTFDFDNNAESNFFSKVNQLRFDKRQINIFANSNQGCGQIIETYELDNIISQELNKLRQQMSNVINSSNRIVQNDRQTRQNAGNFSRYSNRDSSGPSRCSLFTGWF